MLLMSVIWLDLGVTVSIRGAVGCAVPQGSFRLGLQGRAHGDGVGGVGRWVQRDLSGGGGVAERGIGEHVG